MDRRPLEVIRRMLTRTSAGIYVPLFRCEVLTIDHAISRKGHGPLRASTLVVSITTFDGDGRLDEVALAEHFRRLAAADVGVYVGGSSPGEGYTLTRPELERVLAIAHDELKGRVPVRAMGVEPRSQVQMLELAQLVSDADLDAMQIYSLDVGHGNAPAREELERYFRDVLEGTSLPCVLSTHFVVGYLVPLDLIDALIDSYPHLIGINCSTNDMVYLTRLLEVAQGRVEVHVGGPLHAMTVLAQGGQGFLSSDANIAPRLARSVISHFEAAEFEAMFAAYTKLMRLFSANPWPGASARWLKSAMRSLGYRGHHLRAPHLPLTDSDHAVVEDALRRLAIAEGERGDGHG
jgi:4-hydroxy-tetrahydrodipicolinate synthase